MMMKVDDDGDGDGDNDGEHLWWWLLSTSDESYISQRSDVLWRFACGDVLALSWTTLFMTNGQYLEQSILPELSDKSHLGAAAA